MDKTNDLKQLREQIRKLDERLEGEKQVLSRILQHDSESFH